MNLSRFIVVASVLATVLGAEALAQPAPATAPVPAPAPPAKAPPGRNPLAFAAHVAATVNDEVISTYDLQQRMLLLIVTSGVQPTEQNAPQLQREALRGMIDERLQLQEIRKIQTKQKMKIEPTDKEVDEELTDLARSNNLRYDQLAQQLANAGVSINTLRDQIRAQVAWRRYMGGRFGSSIRIGDDQIKASLTRINAAAAKPQFLVSEIFLDAQRVGGADVAMNGAKQLLEQLQQGAPFPAVARQFSSASSAQQGGDEGWLVSGEIAPPLQAALDGLNPGQLSQPIETPEGVYILLLRDRRAGSSSTMVNLKQALAKGPTVLYFYPKSFTAGCTAEAHAFAEASAQFEALGASLIGVSHDSIATQKDFSQRECRDKFAVAADADAKILKQYDAALTVMPNTAARVSFVISPQGKVLYVYDSMDPEQHVANTLKALQIWRQQNKLR